MVMYFAVPNLNPQGSMLHLSHFFIYAVHNPWTKLFKAVKSACPALLSILQWLLCQLTCRAWLTVCPPRSLPAELESQWGCGHLPTLSRTVFCRVAALRALPCWSEWCYFVPHPWSIPCCSHQQKEYHGIMEYPELGLTRITDVQLLALLRTTPRITPHSTTSSIKPHCHQVLQHTGCCAHRLRGEERPGSR